MSGFKSKISSDIVLSLAIFIIIALCQSPMAQDEMLGEYKSIFDSTAIWPDGKGGYDYTRKFISEIVLAEKGRSSLSRPATPILTRDDKIEINAYTKLATGEILKADQTDMVTRTLPGDRRWIFVNFRQAEPGAVLHLEWILTSKDANLAGKRFLGRTVPVDSVTIIVTVPQPWSFYFAIDPGARISQKRVMGASAATPAQMNYIWSAKNLAPLSKEEYAPPMERIIPCLYFSFFHDSGGGSSDSALVNWKYLAGLYYSQIKDFSKVNSSLNPVADSLKKISNKSNILAGMAFDWLNRHFQISYSDISLAGNIDDAIGLGRGTQAEASIMLYSLFEKLRVNSQLYLAATHNVGDPLPNLPALFWFDRLLLKSDVGNDTLWIDPYYQIPELGILPFEDQGIKALNVGPMGGQLTAVPMPDYHDNARAIHLKLDFDSSGAIKGEATEIYSGAMIPELLTYLKTIEKGNERELWEKNLAKSLPNVKVSRFIVIPPDTSGQTYKIGYSFTTGAVIRPFATRAYIPLDLLGRWGDLPALPSKARQFPIELSRPRFELERITINVSDLFAIEDLPENYSDDNAVGEIYSVVRGDKNLITVTRGFGLKKSSLPLSEYGSFRKFLSKARAEADKQIILKKTD